MTMALSNRHKFFHFFHKGPRAATTENLNLKVFCKPQVNVVGRVLGESLLICLQTLFCYATMLLKEIKRKEK